MKKFKVTFRPLAEEDLFALYEYIAARADTETAAGYIERITELCKALETFPERGAPRFDIMPGLRVLAFERRVVIAFRVIRFEVVIVRIFYGGQDYERALAATHK